MRPHEHGLLYELTATGLKLHFQLFHSLQIAQFNTQCEHEELVMRDYIIRTYIILKIQN